MNTNSANSAYEKNEKTVDKYMICTQNPGHIFMN